MADELLVIARRAGALVVLASALLLGMILAQWYYARSFAREHAAELAADAERYANYGVV